MKQLRPYKFTNEELEFVHQILSLLPSSNIHSPHYVDRGIELKAKIEKELEFRKGLVKRLANKQSVKKEFTLIELQKIEQMRFIDNPPKSVIELAKLYEVSYGVMWQLCDGIRERRGEGKKKPGRPKKNGGEEAMRGVRPYVEVREVEEPKESKDNFITIGKNVEVEVDEFEYIDNNGG